jgi:hypothetical protein
MKLKLFLLLLPFSSLAQVRRCDSIKFEMIRETVNFLAKDKNISKDLNFKVDCSKPDYSCLEVNIGKKRLAGVLTKVLIWDQKKKNNTPEDIVKIKERIFADVLEPPDKVYRKNLLSYVAYKNKMEFLLAKGKQPTTTPVRAGSVRPIPKLAKIKTDTAKAQVEGPESIPADDRDPDPPAEAVTSIKEEPINKKDMQSNLVYVALAAAVISMVISFLALTTRRPRSKKSSAPEPAPDNGSAAQSDRIQRVERDLREVDSNVKELQRSVGSLVKKVVELEQTPTVVEFDVKNTRVAPQFVSQPDVSAPVNDSFTRYAKFSDLDNGFSPVMLTDTQNGEQTYKISVGGDRATYEVSDDVKAQKYALQNYEYLSRACQIRNQPQNGCKIYTLTQGVLQRAADQNWLIERQAIIEFR